MLFNLTLDRSIWINLIKYRTLVSFLMVDSYIKHFPVCHRRTIYCSRTKIFSILSTYFQYFYFGLTWFLKIKSDTFAVMRWRIGNFGRPTRNTLMNEKGGRVRIENELTLDKVIVVKLFPRSGIQVINILHPDTS